MQEVENLVDFVVRRADRLTLNTTTNLVENFMSLVAKMVESKRVDFAKGGSYGRQCLAAARCREHTVAPLGLQSEAQNDGTL